MKSHRWLAIAAVCLGCAAPRPPQPPQPPQPPPPVTSSATQRPVPDMIIDGPTRAKVIDQASAKLVAEYVYPEIGEKMAAALRARQRAGEYDKVTSAAAFADLLTDQLRDISHDKHLHVDFDIDADTSERGPREDASFARTVNNGFERAERLEGNIGYIELRGLLDPSLAARTAAAAMAFVADTDALILDLRRNGGGRPEMVALLASYLFDGERIHLNDLHFRRGGRVEESWTVAVESSRRFGRKKLVYVLTSSRTFSGAEELTYDLQVLKRATIIGDVTRGGGNPSDRFPLTEHFAIAVPVGRAVNPITKTSWEGTGVRPDVCVPAADALATAHLIALRAELAKGGKPAAQDYLRETIAAVQADFDREKTSAPSACR